VGVWAVGGDGWLGVGVADGACMHQGVV